MINETNLRQTLVFLVASLKEQQNAIASLMLELVALREAVRGLDPTFAEVIDRKRKETVLKIPAEVQSGLQEFERLLQLLKDGEVC
jgi:hypothetical protein